MLCVDAGARKEERVKRAQLYRGGRRRKESKTSAPTHYSKPYSHKISAPTHYSHKTTTKEAPRVVSSSHLCPDSFLSRSTEEGWRENHHFYLGFRRFSFMTHASRAHQGTSEKTNPIQGTKPPEPQTKTPHHQATSRTKDKSTAPSSNLPNQRQKHGTVRTPFPKDIPTIKTTPEPKQRLWTADDKGDPAHLICSCP